MSIPELSTNTKIANKLADSQLAVAPEFDNPLLELVLLVANLTHHEV